MNCEGVSMDIHLRKRRRDVVGANSVRYHVMVVLVTRVRYLSRLTMFQDTTIVVRVLPTTNQPSVHVEVNEHLVRGTTSVISPVANVSVVDRVNYYLVVVMEAFMNRINGGASSDAFRPFRAYRNVFHRDVVGVCAINQCVLRDQIMGQYMEVYVRFLGVVTSNRDRRQAWNCKFVWFSFRGRFFLLVG